MRLLLPFVLLGLSACASAPEKLPYPAFVETDELADVFLAELPGIRAKRFYSDIGKRSGSYRIDLPPAWSGSSGASPGRALELFVLAGRLTLDQDLALDAGGYAYLPPGSLGFNLRTAEGARVLYSISDVADRAMIRTPLILDSRLLEWRSTDTDGVDEKVLLEDPGSGARTWLTRIQPGAQLPWRLSLAARQSYLLDGDLVYSECFQGEAVTGRYLPGGYVNRPPDTAHGGPEARAASVSIWLHRERTAIGEVIVDGCR